MADKVVFARALYKFEGSRTDNLSFNVGDLITILKQEAGGWWTGSTLDGKIGIFPKNYVELNEGREAFDVLKAEYDFESDKPGDLSFKDGDEIILLRQVSPEWWMGRHEDGREGIFPATYVVMTGEVDYETGEQEAAKWKAYIEKAKSTMSSLARERMEAEKELELQKKLLEEANAKAAESRQQAEAESKKARDAKSQQALEKAKKQEMDAVKAREVAEQRHEEARKKLVSMRLQEDATKTTLEAATEKGNRVDKKKKEEDDRFADPKGAAMEVPSGRKPNREVKQNKFGNLGGGASCPKCKQVTGFADRVKGPGDAFYHVKCLRCSTCDKQLSNGQFSEHDLMPYCAICYGRGCVVGRRRAIITWAKGLTPRGISPTDSDRKDLDSGESWPPTAIPRKTGSRVRCLSMRSPRSRP